MGPLLSIYKTLIKTENYLKIVNIYGERQSDFLVELVYEEMKKFENQFVKNFFYLSREEKKGFYKGYVQQGINPAIDFLGKENLEIFICGKPQMVDESILKLKELGIEKNIYFEKY